MTPNTEISDARILVVDDEPKLQRLVREVLIASGYTVLAANTGAKAIEMIAVQNPDLVLLDIVLADGVDGYEVARQTRGFSDVPIIMLTAKARESDLIKGFDTGADDYLTKPFSAKELLVRIRAVLSRARTAAADIGNAEIHCGSLHIDLARRLVTREGAELQLTRTEFELLCELADHSNQVVQHEQLLSAVWGPEYRDDIDYLRSYIRYLRKKIEANPAEPEYIVTYQGVGYMLACPD
ncbi:MAG: DNA-binding response regulator [Chloroflexi bacterium]|nr:MAG: DNA-binding response regulator [Chloroflexota bacterium]MBL1195017.1 DNA-binding response regulator [Chloroflexota bacterium]NOH12306.1 response regulator transcription factor [Chloroflexota bacterium]